MADVQIDNGEFTRVANVLMEQVAKQHLNGTQCSIILTVWRFTYGFQRCEHKLSVTFIATATGVSTRAIKKELKILIDRNIIIVMKESTKAESRVLKFNKDYESWIEGNKKTPHIQGNNSSPGEQLIPSQGNNSSPKQGNKKTPKKEILKENSKENINVFFETIWKLYPKKDGKGGVSKTQKEKLHKIGLDEMSRAIDRYKKHREEKIAKGEWCPEWKNGSTFFNSGYVDYLDKNYQQPDKSTPPDGITIAW